MDGMHCANWMILLFLTIGFTYVETHHMLHYLHLKKFITAVAFARALGKRPTVLPVPIPIPIPIAQNEIIKLPLPAGGKTMVIGNGGSKQSVDINKLLSGLSQTTSASSTYGYAQPAIGGGHVDLKSLLGGDNNILNLQSTLGQGSNNGPTKIIILRNQNSGKILDSSLDASALLQLGNNNFQFDKEINFGNNLGDLNPAFSFRKPEVFNFPSNLYTDAPRRKIPFVFAGRRRKSPAHINYLTHPRLVYHQGRVGNISQNSNSLHSSNGGSNAPENVKKEHHKRPISVGEKFDTRP